MTTHTPEKWFATPIWRINIEDVDVVNETIFAAMASLPEDEGGINRSNVGGWHSGTQLYKAPGFETIRQRISTTAVECAQSLDFNFDTHALVLKEMWLNRNGPGAYNKAHIHPGSFLSGVYYVTVPEGAGAIEFTDPITARTMAGYPMAKANAFAVRSIRVNPKPGLMVFFPSWLQHSVSPNTGEEERISISFNIGYRPRGKAQLADDQANKGSALGSKFE